MSGRPLSYTPEQAAMVFDLADGAEKLSQPRIAERAGLSERIVYRLLRSRRLGLPVSQHHAIVPSSQHDTKPPAEPKPKKGRGKPEAAIAKRLESKDIHNKIAAHAARLAAAPRLTAEQERAAIEAFLTQRGPLEAVPVGYAIATTDQLGFGLAG